MYSVHCSKVMVSPGVHPGDAGVTGGGAEADNAHLVPVAVSLEAVRFYGSGVQSSTVQFVQCSKDVN